MSKKIKIGIIDCNFGNIASLINSFKFLNFDFKVIEKKIIQDDISHLILPGVGSFNKAAKTLKKIGFDDQIKEFTSKSKPFMGICLGMQLMFDSSTEDGKEYGLGLFQGECNRFSDNLKVSLPHVGFNLVDNYKTKIWKGIPCKSPFYFVHSYRISINKKKSNQAKLSKTYYGEDFVSFIEQENIFGAQFHPEKSHKTGLNLLKNFVAI